MGCHQYKQQNVQLTFQHGLLKGASIQLPNRSSHEVSSKLNSSHFRSAALVAVPDISALCLKQASQECSPNPSSPKPLFAILTYSGPSFSTGSVYDYLQMLSLYAESLRGSTRHNWRILRHREAMCNLWRAQHGTQVSNCGAHFILQNSFSVPFLKHMILNTTKGIRLQDKVAFVNLSPEQPGCKPHPKGLCQQGPRTIISIQLLHQPPIPGALIPPATEHKHKVCSQLLANDLGR